MFANLWRGILVCVNTMSKLLSFEKVSTTCGMGQKGYMGQISIVTVMFVAILPIPQVSSKLVA
jgi:hypothetical protein